jgi:histidine triad (HIT) family protein
MVACVGAIAPAKITRVGRRRPDAGGSLGLEPTAWPSSIATIAHGRFCPWRCALLENGSPLTEASCLFCRIARKEIPADRVLENDDLVAFRDINPQARVHVLVIPREHITSLNELETRHTELVGKLHLAARDIARQEGLAEGGWRLVTNVGADAGQTVPHLHFHVIGGRALKWPPG